jgi:hypothetical protein
VSRCTLNFVKTLFDLKCVCLDELIRIVLFGGFNLIAPMIALSNVFVVMNEVRTNGYLL